MVQAYEPSFRLQCMHEERPSLNKQKQTREIGGQEVYYLHPRTRFQDWSAIEILHP